MKVHTLKNETFIPASLERVWAYFSSPHNLMEITPKYMNFRVTKCEDVASIYKGMLIEYKVSPLLGIALKWVTEITDVQHEQSFIDTQLKGPFSLWEHTHIFKPVDGGVHMTDIVRYAIPFGIIGSIAHALFVKRQLNGIFTYRSSVIDRLFPAG